MNYYAVYDAKTGILLAEGNAVECRRKLKCSSLDTFYALVNRANRGINKKYKLGYTTPSVNDVTEWINKLA